MSAKREQLWGWWCAAPGHPEIARSSDRLSDGARIRCDLSPSEGRWGFVAFRTIERRLYERHAAGRADWLLTPEELQLDGLEMEGAVVIAHGPVDVTTA